MSIDPRIVKARTALVVNQPFFGTLALYLEVVEEPEVETMATDGIKLFYAPAFLDKLSSSELQGVMAHEVMHCAFKHQLRRKHRDGQLWNIAADYAINHGLIQAGFKLPKDALLDPRYNGRAAEDIYAELKKEAEAKAQSPAPGKDGPKSPPGAPGSASSPSPGPWGQVIDGASRNAPGQLGEQEAEWDRRARQACNVAAASNAGKTPKALEHLVTSLNKPSIDWRSELRRFVDATQRTDHSWTNPSRRYLSLGLHLPGMEADGIAKLAVIIDTSGSVQNSLFKQFLGEIQSILDDGAVAEIIVLQCDAAVQKVIHFFPGDNVDSRVYGRGGTRFSPAFDWINELAPDTAAAIYLTDLDCTDHGKEPAYPVLWAAYGNRQKPVPFGEVLQLKEI